MKKNRSILLLLAGLALTTSCNKFLEEEPKSTITLGAYYKTQADAEGTVNSLYRRGATQRYSNAGSAYVGPTASVNTMLTGYFTNSYEGQERICLFSRELTRQANTNLISNTMNSIWNDSYSAINIANAGIKYIPQINMSDDTKTKLIAEAKFFRAFNYFYLVKTFGNIPLSIDVVEKLGDVIYPERTDAVKIYELIESDLKEAVAGLPAVKFAANGHRITKYVAAMTLANVYLQQGKNTEAIEAAKIVINSGHSLTPNTDFAANSAFNKLRKTDDLDEVIYAQEFDAVVNSGGWWPTYALNSSAVSVFNKYSIFERVYGPTAQFLNVYAADDLRIQPNQFFHWNYTWVNEKSETKNWTSTDAGVWYYFDEEALQKTGKATKDWNFYRYPEALLIAAEAITANTGVNAEAAGYLAQVKARANTANKTVAAFTAELQGLSKDKFIEECWNERLRELPLEFKMWDDILRTKKFPVISKTTKGSISYVNLVGAANASGAIFKDSDLLWPISQDEIKRNPKLVQNPGYN